MANEISSEDFTAAADSTQVGEISRAGAKLVLVEGRTPAQAARFAHSSRQAIHAAVKVIRRAHETITSPGGCRWVKILLPNAMADEAERSCMDRHPEQY